MERLKLKYLDAQKALQSMEDILEEPFSVIVRDASIQRFEYTFEALWKFLKEYLNEKKGIVCNSPKDCIREIFSVGFLTEDETKKFLEMVDKRNQTSHTYKEKVAAMIYDFLHEYGGLMKKLVIKFEREIN